ncbi:MAG: CDP-archaeol synthase [Tissierellia bacterium]|jgi:phosphatidate cytidylyltransferase|nr:CDP-archaeol synthase [Bacillota bacterium]NLL22205.1 CDP-archaeol synthase [Tissierellia bacterium]
MITRIVSAVVGLALLVLFLVLGGTTLKIAMILVTMLAMVELKRAFKVSFRLDDLLSALFVSIIFFMPTDLAFVMMFSYLIVSILVQMLFLREDLQQVVARYFCFSYVTIPFYLLWRLIEFGPERVYLLVFIVAWVSDTAAYYVGTFFGTRKIAAHISPNKTLEGFAGGIVAGVVVAALFKLIFVSGASFIGVFFFSIFGSMLATLGDLVASYIKRKSEIKDFGFIIPGHGGIMDRFDSVLPVAVLLYLMLGFIV